MKTDIDKKYKISEMRETRDKLSLVLAKMEFEQGKKYLSFELEKRKKVVV